MSGGFVVKPEALAQFANDLPKYGQQAGQFQQLVSQADVSNEAGGIVGVFTKQEYGNLLSQLQQLLRQLGEGCELAARKYQSAGDIYRQIDNDTAEDFSSIDRTVEV